MAEAIKGRQESYACGKTNAAYDGILIKLLTAKRDISLWLWDPAQSNQLKNIRSVRIPTGAQSGKP